MDYLSQPSLDILDTALDTAIATELIPYPSVLGSHITPAQAAARYANLKAWYQGHGHFWVGTGPYYLDTVDLSGKTLTLKNNTDYIDVAGRWAQYNNVTGSITGHVYQSNGITPVENMAVGLLLGYGYEYAQACTDSTGFFEFNDIPSGVSLRVVAVPAWRCTGQPEGYTREYWQDTYAWNQATVITLSASQPNYGGIIFNLEQGQTATQVVGTEGGTIATPDESVKMDIPVGAVPEETTFTITDGGAGYQVVTDEGSMDAVTSTTIGPPGTTFDVPVTLTFTWRDANDDGIVDGITIPEGTLYLSKDGLVLAGPCSTDPACDLDANTVSVQVSSLSFFVVGPLVPDAPAAFGKTAPVNSANNISLFPTLSWQASAGATGYQYCIDTTNDNACASWASTGSNTSVSLSGLNPNTTYYWQVRATNPDGTTYANGAATAFWSFTTGEATATFPDVSTGYWAWAYVERLYNAGLTGGYPDGTYRPANTVTRAEMAIFLMKGMNGPAYTPPTVSPTFSDTSGHWAANWIEALKAAGLTGGYPDGTYRPNSPVTRAEMAIFLLKAMNGAAYTPPSASPTFSDTSSHWAANWIEALKAAGITSGYPDGTYRPGNYVTRAEMAVFLVKAFGLP
jgi:hypothetical protein